MRDLRFRGKRISDGKWEHGYFYETPDGPAILSIGGMWPSGTFFPYSQVEPDSVGQSTGIKDKNGIDIFEGDRVIIKETPSSVDHGGIVIYDSEPDPVHGYITGAWVAEGGYHIGPWAWATEIVIPKD